MGELHVHTALTYVVSRWQLGQAKLLKQDTDATQVALGIPLHCS